MARGFWGDGKKRETISRRRKAILASASPVRGIEALESRVMLAATPYYGRVLQLPGLWQAEAFDNGGEGVAYHDTTTFNEGGAFRATGVDIEATSDAGGGYDVGSVHAGEWLGYSINIPSTGNYDFSARVADAVQGGSFHLELDGVDVTGSMFVPATGGWQTFTTITKSNVTMTAGNHFAKVVMDVNGRYSYMGNFNWFQVTASAVQPPPLPTVSIAATQPNASETGPTSGTFTITRTGATTSPLTVAYAIGGSAANGSDYAQLTTSVTIPAGASSATVTVAPIDDSLVEGNETVLLALANNAAYQVGSATNATVTIADNDVATTLPTVTIAATQPNASETGPASGTFTITRSGATTQPLSVFYSAGGTATNGSDYAQLPTSATIPAGASSATVTVTPIDDSLVEGSETVLLTISSNGSYQVGAAGNATVTIADNDTATPPPPGSTPFSGTPISVPGLIEVENFDNGGEGVAFHDTTAANEGGSYRTTSVDVEPAADTGGGYDVGWAHAGEWLLYTVNVASAGNYDLAVRVADSFQGGTFHVEVDGANVSGALTVPNTGSWQAYTTVGKAGIALTAGQHIVKLVMDTDGTYGFTGNFNWMKFTAVNAPPQLPVVTIGSTDPNASETGPKSGTFSVSRTGDTSQPLTVNYSIGGTATNGTDYASLSGSVTIAAGASSAPITVAPVDDTLVEGPESVALTLSLNAAYSVGGASNATVTIADNDSGNGQQPDLLIRNYQDSNYVGGGVINTTGIDQIKGQGQPFFPSIFQVKVVNTGTTADSFNITGSPSPSPNWRVWYFDSQVQQRFGGNDITAAVTGAGWNTGVLQPGQFKEFRFEAGASPLVPANEQIILALAARSAGDPNKVDIVKAVAGNVTRRELDIRRRNFATADAEAGTYLLDLQNNGNIADQYRVTAPGNGVGYTVRYFDAYSGGNDITAAVTGSGWTTTPLGFRSLQNMAVQLTSTDGKVHSITLTATSVGDPTLVKSVPIANAKPYDPPSFFPIGVWSQPGYSFDTWKSRGINTMVGYESQGGAVSIDSWTNVAVSKGLYIMRQPRPNPADDIGQQNLLAWMQPDEPELKNGYSAAIAQQNYNAWKQVDPSRPIMTNFAGGYIMRWQIADYDYPGYLKATDWVSSGTYPISGWNRPDDLDVSGRTLDRFENLSNGAPQFAIIESSDQLGSWTAPGSPGPNAQQVRAETWDAIIHGAKGIIYFPQSLTPTFNYDNTPPDIAAEITTQNARITSIGQALVSQIDPPTLGFTGGAPLEATWRIFNGQKYYVVLNMSPQTLTNQTMTLKGVGSATTATVQGESRSVSVSNGTITDTFAPYEVHIYLV